MQRCCDNAGFWLRLVETVRIQGKRKENSVLASVKSAHNLQAIVGRERLGSASVADFSSNDAISTSELSLGKPKSAHRKSCLLGFDIIHIVERWFNYLNGAAKCTTRFEWGNRTKRTKKWCDKQCTGHYSAFLLCNSFQFPFDGRG